MIYIFGFILFLVCLPMGMTVYLALLKYRIQRDELILFGEIRTP